MQVKFLTTLRWTTSQTIQWCTKVMQALSLLVCPMHMNGKDAHHAKPGSRHQPIFSHR